jgi:hypothetical protein
MSAETTARAWCPFASQDADYRMLVGAIKKDIRSMLEQVELELRAYKQGQLTTGQDCADLVRKLKEAET